MYRQGHYGVALLVWSPIGAVLTLLDLTGLALLGLTIMLAVEQLPDYDMRVSFVKHRGVSHTALFALLIGALVGALLAASLQIEGMATALEWAPGFDQAAPPALVLGLAGFAWGTLAILAHLAADVITPSGIPVAWPVNDQRYSFDWVYAKDTAANYGLLGAGLLVAAPTFIIVLGGDPLAVVG